MNHSRIMLTPSDVSVLHLVEDCEMDMFTVPELETLSGLGHRKLIEALSRLVSVGSLSRIERGVYCTRNFRNINAIATKIVKDSAIAYWTALNLHGMTEQIPNVVFVQSCNPKTDKEIFGVRCKFVRVKKDAYTGIMQMGYGSDSFNVTDREKTLIDCFCLPGYSGGYAELLRAFSAADPDAGKLLEYGKKVGNLSVLKRMAYLSELWEMKGFDDFRSEVSRMLNSKYSLLDPFGDNRGPFINKWKIRSNIGKDDLDGIREKIY